MTILNISKSIIMLAIIAGIMSLVRFSLTGYDSYLWLNWNLFLALLPILFAWLTIIAKKKWLAFVALILWLAFLPNAPYLLTDFIHLADVGPRSYIWYDAAMIFMYTLTGIASWIFSLGLLKNHFHWKLWTIWFIAVLSGFGVYLGRYLRFNSWNVVTKPLDLLENVGNIIIYPLEHNPMLMMTTVFAILLGSLYFISSTLVRYEKTPN